MDLRLCCPRMHALMQRCNMTGCDQQPPDSYAQLLDSGSAHQSALLTTGTAVLP